MDRVTPEKPTRLYTQVSRGAFAIHLQYLSRERAVPTDP